MELEKYLRKRYSPETVKVYMRGIEAYRGSVPDPEGATYGDITAYLGILRKRYTNPATLNRTLSAIKAYHAYLVHTGRRGDDPARSVLLRDKRNRDVQLQDLLTKKELEELLKKGERYHLLTIRNRVLMSLLVHQAPTPSEMERLNVADVLLKAGKVSLGPTTRTDHRELELRPDQVMLLYEYLHETRPRLLKGGTSERLLIGTRGNPMAREDITKHVKRRGKEVFGDKRVNATVIRQSVIANLLRAGHDLRRVQFFAGHKYPSTTEKYRGTDSERLKAEVERYHPMG